MKGILFASFGTTNHIARERQIDSTAGYLCREFPAWQVRQAYTSEMVRARLEKDGIRIPNVPQALEEMARDGVERVVVLPGHILPGAEYEKLRGQSYGLRRLFRALAVARPLLFGEGDLAAMAGILAGEYPRTAGACTVLVGHGTRETSNAAYAALDYRMKEMGRDDLFVGTVEAYPTREHVLGLLEKTRYKRVRLAPLMQVAGEHAVNDIAGATPDSWAGALRAKGFEVVCRLTGLGEMAAVQKLVAEHAGQACEDWDGF